MAFIGNQPTAVPLTSSQLVDGIITTAKLATDAVTSAKILDSTIVNADIASTTINLTQKVTGTLPYANGGTGVSTLGTANQVLAVNASATALEFQSVSSDYVLLATTNASSSSSITFDGYFSSTYKNYQIIISSLRPSTDATLYMRFRRSNADVTASNYTYVSARGYVQNTGNQGVDNDPSNFDVTAFDFGDGLNAGETAPFGANLMIYDPLDTTIFKTFTGQHFWEFTNNAQWNTSNWGGTLRNSTAALSGVSFYMASGTILQGNFKLYGIK